MSQKIKVFIVGFIVITIAAVAGFFMVKNMFKPNTEVMELDEYYKSQTGAQLSDSTAVLILENEIQSTLLTYEDGEVYIDLDMVTELFNEGFYWDYNEKVLLYTLPDETIEVYPGKTQYLIGDKENEFEHIIVKNEGDSVKLALSFVEQYSDIKSEFYENPNRVVLNYKWDEDKLVATVEKDTQLRYSGSSKGEILKELKKGDELNYIMSDNTDVSKGYVRVATKDGVLGYVKSGDMSDTRYVTVESEFEKPVYTSIHKDYDINLTWNMVTNQDANAMMPDLLKNAPGVNTISPTWFAISDTDGSISSIASHDYVDKAHEMGVEVWAAVNDFTPDVSIKDILTHTTSRRSLTKNLMELVKEYNLDGINIDFEYIKESFAKDYIQFIREISVECRKEQVVLSVDSYVPVYSKFYNRTVQGQVADYVIIMAYDEHDSNSMTSGSVASISWTQAAIDQTKEQVEDSKKIIIGIPFYDRLWEEEGGSDGNTVLLSHKDLTMKESINVISDNGASVKWDEQTKQNYVEYTKGTHVFKMWLEDAKSIEEKVKLISQAGVGGIASWRLGQETSDVWPVINNYINK